MMLCVGWVSDGGGGIQKGDGNGGGNCVLSNSGWFGDICRHNFFRRGSGLLMAALIGLW